MNLKARAEDMRSFFNRKAKEDYDSVHLTMMNSKEPVAKLLPEGAARILDLGGGTGLELIPLFERFPDARVTVIDVAEEMLNRLRERPFADKVEMICGDFFLVDFGEGFDAVISTSALHHFNEEDKCRLYRKAFNCLRPGGILINSDKCAETQEEQDHWFRELSEAAENYVHLDTPLTPENECRLLKKVGFGEVDARPIESSNYCLISARKPERR